MKNNIEARYSLMKEKVFRILSFIFFILTFIGAGYVLINEGEVNAGYAVIPSLFCVVFSQLSIMEKRNNNKNKVNWKSKSN